MAVQSLSLADAILKDLYVGPIVEQVNYKTYLLDQIQRDSDSIDHTGRRAVWPVHRSGNRGRGSISEGGALPGAGRQDWIDAIIPIREHFYAIGITDASIEATKNSEGAFVNLLQAETQGVAKDMKKDVNRQVFGTGDGLLASCNTSETASTIHLDSIQYLKVGDPVDVRTRATGAAVTNGAGLVVSARDPVAKTISLQTPAGANQSVTVTAAEGVYLAGNRNNEMDGLRNMISTARTLHSIDSTQAANGFWNAGSSAAAGGATVGESLFEQMFDNVGQGGNGDVEVALTTRGIRRRLADTYQSQKRYNDAQAVNVHGGFSAIMVNEIPVVIDDDCPKGFAFGLNKESLKWFQQAGPGWLESKDGTIFQLQPGATQGTYNATWLAWFKWYASFACIAPNRNGVITGGADDAAI